MVIRNKQRVGGLEITLVLVGSKPLITLIGWLEMAVTKPINQYSLSTKEVNLFIIIKDVPQFTVHCLFNVNFSRTSKLIRPIFNRTFENC